MILQKGLILSFITVVIWALERVSSRFAMVTLDVHPVIFTCFSLFICSIVLIIVAGPGKGGLSTLKKPHTWIYGVLQVLMNVTDMLMLALITSTEASFLARISIVMAIFIKWLFFNYNTPRRYDWAGILLILIGVFMVAKDLPDDIRVIALFWLFLTALFNTLRTIVAETHPEAVLANSIKRRCRVTGYVILTTSFVLIAFLFATAYVKTQVPNSDNFILLMNMPSLTDLMHRPTIATAGIMGITLLPIAMYFYFYSAQVAKTEVFLMVASIQPFIAFSLESILQNFGLLNISQITNEDLVAGIIIVLGAVIMIYGRHLKHRKHRVLVSKV